MVQSVFLPHRNQAFDGNPLFQETPFIIRQNPGHAVCVQIPCHFPECPALLVKLVQRPLKQSCVVCFETDLSSHRKKIRIDSQKCRCCQPKLGVAAFRPWIAEVDIYPVQFSRSKDLSEASRVIIQKAHIFEFCGTCTLHGQDHGVGDLLDGNEIAVWFCCCHCTCKAPFAAAYLQPEALIGVSP